MMSSSDNVNLDMEHPFEISNAIGSMKIDNDKENNFTKLEASLSFPPTSSCSTFSSFKKPKGFS
jgi:hypothetical protein